jgi:exopolysaccharide biosynthesis protein
MPLLTYCEQSEIDEAIIGGFFLRNEDGSAAANPSILGDIWLSGKQIPSAPILSTWGTKRGSIYIAKDGQIHIEQRDQLPEIPSGDLLQAGPLLVRNGEPVLDDTDSEGFGAGAIQFDRNFDITKGRNPRAAIGINSKYIWSVVCDGRTKEDSGMTLQELAAYMVKLGATSALNLDGGSSATQISNRTLTNRPRKNETVEYIIGREVNTAIVFEQNIALQPLNALNFIND